MKEKFVTTFIVAYLVIWSTVACYVAFLGVRQRQLAREIEELRAKFADERDFTATTEKAA